MACQIRYSEMVSEAISTLKSNKVKVEGLLSLLCPYACHHLSSSSFVEGILISSAITGLPDSCVVPMTC